MLLGISNIDLPTHIDSKHTKGKRIFTYSHKSDKNCGQM